MMQKFSHPCIVDFVESFVDDEVIVIVMEYCQGGDLETLIRFHKEQKAEFPEETIKDWTAQLASALSHIHSMKIIHRDIKPSNIFITVDGRLKLGDFGISKALEHTNDSASTLIGTPLYMSPEVCNNKKYSYKTDIWSLGCVVFELCTFNKPFMADSIVALAFKILNEKIPEVSEKYSDMRKIVENMMDKNPETRPSARDLLNWLGMADIYSNPDISKEKSQLYLFPAESLNFESYTASKSESYSSDFESFSMNQESVKYEDDFESFTILNP
jgi:NIMA (never in mitosis gene a)-related kinase